MANRQNPVLLVLVGAALLGNLTLIVLDPITILNRTLATAVWPGLRSAVTQVETFFYQFPPLWPVLDAVHAAVVQPLFQQVQPVFALSIPIGTLLCRVGDTEPVGRTVLVPVPMPLGRAAGPGLPPGAGATRGKRACTQCARCTHQCPTDTINPNDNYRSDPAECLVCFDCLVACPRSGIGFRWQLPYCLQAA